jgi:hypothetical protein
MQIHVHLNTIIVEILVNMFNSKREKNYLSNFFPDKYISAGQNLAFIAGSQKFPKAEESFEEIITSMWFGEYAIANMSDIEKMDCGPGASEYETRDFD